MQIQTGEDYAVQGYRGTLHSTVRFYPKMQTSGLDHTAFNYLISATPNDAYNALVCVEFAPELGRHRVFQVTSDDNNEDDADTIAFTSRGRTLTSRKRSFDALTKDWWEGWRFRSTNLSAEYTLDDLYKDRGDDLDLILAKKPEGGLEFIQPGKEAHGPKALWCSASVLLKIKVVEGQQQKSQV